MFALPAYTHDADAHADHVAHVLHLAHLRYLGYTATWNPATDGDGDHDGDMSDVAPILQQQPAAQAPSSIGTVTGTPGSYQACVIQAESGGDARAVNPSSGAGGLYGFLPSTWQGLGYSGLPENASVAEQTQAFNTLYAQAGRAPWITDGC